MSLDIEGNIGAKTNRSFMIRVKNERIVELLPLHGTMFDGT